MGSQDKDGGPRRPRSGSRKIIQFCQVFEGSEKKEFSSRKSKRGLPSFKSEKSWVEVKQLQVEVHTTDPDLWSQGVSPNSEEMRLVAWQRRK